MRRESPWVLNKDLPGCMKGDCVVLSSLLNVVSWSWYRPFSRKLGEGAKDGGRVEGSESERDFEGVLLGEGPLEGAI